MTGPVTQSRLAAATWECGRHRAALVDALAEWHAMPTPSSDDLERDSALRRLTDQIIYRFTKLQDTMGERLVPATLDWLGEPHESWPMRDRLDRLEKIGYLDAEAWLQWRDVRNRLAHEYPGAARLRYEAVLAAIDAAGAMIQALDHWMAKLPA
jgi:uncharacterized protein with HEPN domain